MDTALASRRSLVLWAGWVVFALLLMPLVGQWDWLFLASVAGSALALNLLTRSGPARPTEAASAGDLPVIAVFYVAVVAAMRLAFVVFGTDHIPGLFLSFALALLLGVVGPVVYTVWTRGGSLHDLGLRRDNWQTTAVLAALLAAVQFTITLWGYALPAPVDWVPLLVMALVVGVFEATFFRGFIQNRLEARFGPRVGIGGAALLYGFYHVGYGMGVTDIAFLTGLGITYAVAFSLTRNMLVLWPLLTPLGSFYAQIKNGGIELPWASIMGFADVAMVMVAAFWFAHRHERKRLTAARQPALGDLHESRT
jgi:uncharacterized protein